MNMKEERLEIIIGDTKEPLFHTTTTVGRLNEIIDVLFMPKPIPRPPLRRVVAVEESIEIQTIRQECDIKEQRLRDELRIKLIELRFEEKLAVEALKKKEEHPK